MRPCGAGLLPACTLGRGPALGIPTALRRRRRGLAGRALVAHHPIQVAGDPGTTAARLGSAPHRPPSRPLWAGQFRPGPVKSGPTSTKPNSVEIGPISTCFEPVSNTVEPIRALAQLGPDLDRFGRRRPTRTRIDLRAYVVARRICSQLADWKLHSLDPACWVSDARVLYFVWHLSTEETTSLGR